jgi:hypothetical protein
MRIDVIGRKIITAGIKGLLEKKCNDQSHLCGYILGMKYNGQSWGGKQ